jgi:hypothetical protein
MAIASITKYAQPPRHRTLFLLLISIVKHQQKLPVYVSLAYVQGIYSDQPEDDDDKLEPVHAQ